MTDTTAPVTPERTLAERIEEDYAPAWRPEPGDSLIGFVQEITVGTTDFGDYPIVTLITGKDRRSVHAFHTTLQGALIDAAPSIGEEIAVKYNGLRVPKPMLDKSGNVPADVTKKFDTKDDPRYHDYRVIVNRAPADVWGKLKENRPAGRNA